MSCARIGDGAVVVEVLKKPATAVEGSGRIEIHGLANLLKQELSTAKGGRSHQRLAALT
jgi:hypothetical protein